MDISKICETLCNIFKRHKTEFEHVLDTPKHLVSNSPRCGGTTIQLKIPIAKQSD